MFNQYYKSNSMVILHSYTNAGHLLEHQFSGLKLPFPASSNSSVTVLDVSIQALGKVLVSIAFPMYIQYRHLSGFGSCRCIVTGEFPYIHFIAYVRVTCNEAGRNIILIIEITIRISAFKWSLCHICQCAIFDSDNYTIGIFHVNNCVLSFYKV